MSEDKIYVVYDKGRPRIFSALASMLWPGLGQLFQGRLLAATVFTLSMIAAIITSFAWFGIPFVLLIWIWAVLDAAQWRPHVKKYQMKSPNKFKCT